jgi:hypothetical protein
MWGATVTFTEMRFNFISNCAFPLSCISNRVDCVLPVMTRLLLVKQEEGTQLLHQPGSPQPGEEALTKAALIWAGSQQMERLSLD